LGVGSRSKASGAGEQMCISPFKELGRFCETVKQTILVNALYSVSNG
jgi:hypothetical protein